MIKILVVDDSKSVHAFIRDCFSNFKISITQAFNGSQALEILATDLSFNLILLDWEMPVLTGPETLKRVKEKEIKIPIAMMTTRNAVEEVAQMIHAGASEYIMKPFTHDILIEKVEAVLGRKLNDAS